MSAIIFVYTMLVVLAVLIAQRKNFGVGESVVLTLVLGVFGIAILLCMKAVPDTPPATGPAITA